MQSSGRAGWYYRVLEGGIAEPGDFLRLVDRPRPAWSLERLYLLLYRDMHDGDGLTKMTAIPELAQNWRELARRRMNSGNIEDWARRLNGGG